MRAGRPQRVQLHVPSSRLGALGRRMVGDGGVPGESVGAEGQTGGSCSLFPGEAQPSAHSGSPPSPRPSFASSLGSLTGSMYRLFSLRPWAVSQAVGWGAPAGGRLLPRGIISLPALGGLLSSLGNEARTQCPRPVGRSSEAWPRFLNSHLYVETMKFIAVPTPPSELPLQAGAVASGFPRAAFCPTPHPTPHSTPAGMGSAHSCFPRRQDGVSTPARKLPLSRLASGRPDKQELRCARGRQHSWASVTQLPAAPSFHSSPPRPSQPQPGAWLRGDRHRQ